MLIHTSQESFEYLEFTPLERRFYDSIYHRVKQSFDKLNAKGLIGKNYTHILAMLMKLVFLCVSLDSP